MTNCHLRLKPHRKRSGFTQKELAFLLGGKKHSTISRYEAGERKPDLRTAVAYCVLFDRALADLFPGLHADVLGQIGERAERMSQEIGREGQGARAKFKLEKLIRLTGERSKNATAV